MKVDRFMLAAVSSGTGKTLITCGVLRLLKNMGKKTVSFKCGPDFIDPMFHSAVLGTKSRNLDPYFTGRDRTRMLLADNAAGTDLAVLEGVMGYYDGISADSSEGGSSDLAVMTETPVILIVSARGMSRSVLALIRGFLDFPGGRMIRGILLNRVSGSFYPKLKQMIERETGIPVVGYVPVLDQSMQLESRHLGLVLPAEIPDLQKNIDRLAQRLADTLDLPAILAIAAKAPDIPDAEVGAAKAEIDAIMRQVPAARRTEDLHSLQRVKGSQQICGKAPETDRMPLRIGLAKDEAFCFFYEDNLELLKKYGAELIPFSPVHDTSLPENLDGLLLHGGYPELYAEELASQAGMREEIRQAILAGMPVQAECGGFLYLHRQLITQDGRTFPMAGVFPGRVWYTGHLKRFGYIELSGSPVFGENIGRMRSHEFHYYESEDPGEDLLAVKPSGTKKWRCAKCTDTMYAGFPHLYYYAAPAVAAAFLARCRDYHTRTYPSGHMKETVQADDLHSRTDDSEPKGRGAC